MKKFIGLLVLILLVVGGIYGQEKYTTASIFSEKTIIWFGIDFSNIRLIGDAGFEDPDHIVSEEFGAMNKIIVNEPEKYDIAKFFYKETVDIDLSVIKERNLIENPESIVLPSGSTYAMTVSQISSMISEYEPAFDNGIGLVFIAEKFEKDIKQGTIWVTFFNVTTGEVLLAEKMTGKAKGFTWKNYWVRTAYNIMKSVEKSVYYSWKKKYK